MRNSKTARRPRHSARFNILDYFLLILFIFPTHRTRSRPRGDIEQRSVSYHVIDYEYNDENEDEKLKEEVRINLAFQEGLTVKPS